MTLLILAVVVSAFAFILLTKYLWSNQKPKISKAMIMVLAAVLLVGLTILMASGRMHWMIAMGTALLPFLRVALRVFSFLPLLRFAQNAFGQFAGSPFVGSQANTNDASNVSETETNELRMQLDHTSQKISGTVISGEFIGRPLDSLNDAELRSLYTSLTDPQSVRLLESYIDKMHPNFAYGEGQSEQDESRSESGTSMTLDRACAILDVALTATEEEINSAYQRLIAKIHPDRGGSSYFATELNEARAYLINRLS